jgi:hypothetical protein
MALDLIQQPVLQVVLLQVFQLGLVEVWVGFQSFELGSYHGWLGVEVPVKPRLVLVE